MYKLFFCQLHKLKLFTTEQSNKAKNFSILIL